MSTISTKSKFAMELKQLPNPIPLRNGGGMSHAAFTDRCARFAEASRTPGKKLSLEEWGDINPLYGCGNTGGGGLNGKKITYSEYNREGAATVSYRFHKSINQVLTGNIVLRYLDEYERVHVAPESESVVCTGSKTAAELSSERLSKAKRKREVISVVDEPAGESLAKKVKLEKDTPDSKYRTMEETDPCLIANGIDTENPNTMTRYKIVARGMCHCGMHVFSDQPRVRFEESGLYVHDPCPKYAKAAEDPDWMIFQKKRDKEWTDKHGEGVYFDNKGAKIDIKGKLERDRAIAKTQWSRKCWPSSVNKTLLEYGDFLPDTIEFQGVPPPVSMRCVKVDDVYEVSKLDFLKGCAMWEKLCLDLERKLPREWAALHPSAAAPVDFPGLVNKECTRRQWERMIVTSGKKPYLDPTPCKNLKKIGNPRMVGMLSSIRELLKWGDLDF